MTESDGVSRKLKMRTQELELLLSERVADLQAIRRMLFDSDIDTHHTSEFARAVEGLKTRIKTLEGRLRDCDKAQDSADMARDQRAMNPRYGDGALEAAEQRAVMAEQKVQEFQGYITDAFRNLGCMVEPSPSKLPEYAKNVRRPVNDALKLDIDDHKRKIAELESHLRDRDEACENWAKRVKELEQMLSVEIISRTQRGASELAQQVKEVIEKTKIVADPPVGGSLSGAQPVLAFKRQPAAHVLGAMRLEKSSDLTVAEVEDTRRQILAALKAAGLIDG